MAATPFQLTVEDALAISEAICDKINNPSSVMLPSNGKTYEVFVSKNGCRRCDVSDDASKALGYRDGWMKLMEQNADKSSAAAGRARAGAKIVHILPLDKDGGHSNGPGWGMCEDGKLSKNSKASIDQASFEAYKKGSAAAKKKPAAKKRAAVKQPDAVAPAPKKKPKAAAIPQKVYASYTSEDTYIRPTDCVVCVMSGRTGLGAEADGKAPEEYTCCGKVYVLCTGCEDLQVGHWCLECGGEDEDGY